MKKKFITLFLAVVFILCNATVAFAATGDPAVTGQELEAIMGNENVLIVDVRTKEKYDAAHIPGSLSYPLFVGNTVDTTLENNFTQYVKDNLKDFEGKDIYLLCNGGRSGADAGRRALLATGNPNIPADKIFTITGGANDTYVSQNLLHYYVTGEQAVAASQDANSGVLIVDVRTKANYDIGHLKGSLSYPLFGTKGVDATLKSNFTQYVKDNKATFENKTIYILCNSGNSGAVAGTKALIAAGISYDKIFTITGGAAGAEVKAALTYVSADQTISVMDNKDYVIIDVRSAANYAKGHLNGSVSVPLFGADNKVTTGSDDLATAFTKYVNDNKTALSGKTIYILCNSGNSGAKNATTLLAAAGIKENVYTIDGGATNASIQAKFVTDAPTSPKTGDAASSMMYVMLMVVALGAVVVINKKRFAK